MTVVSTIVCSFMYGSWNAKSFAPHTVSDLKNDNAIIVNDSSRNTQLGVDIDPGCGHHVQTDRLPIRSGDSGSRTLLVVEPFAPRILVKNLVQMKNRSGGGATTKSKGKRTGPHGSSRPKRHERALHQFECFLGVRDIHGIPRGIKRAPSSVASNGKGHFTRIALSLLRTLSFVYTHSFRFSCRLRTYIVLSSGEPY